jgi:xanthine dehydrogenase accessory factor
MDRAARAALRAAAQTGTDCVLVRVERIEGSAPREAGAGMVVTADAAVGTIGGGHLELKSIALAREQLAQGTPAAAHTMRFPLGPALGQCCGGVAYIRFERCARGILPAGLTLPEPPPLFRLMLFGAGHVAQALVQVLAGVECAITWVDGREQQFPAQIPEPVKVEFSDNPALEVRDASAGAFYLVMTHSHALDLEIVAAVLKRGDAAYLGLIGSKSKRQRFEHRLAAQGFSPQQIAGITSPIGVAGLSGKAPGVVAIATAAQLLQVAEALREATPQAASPMLVRA